MDILERKKRARGATLGAATAFKTIGVQVGDEIYAVREPTLREQGEIQKAAQVTAIAGAMPDVDIAKLQVAAVVKCACLADPKLGEDGKPLFEDVPKTDPFGKPVMEPELDADGKPVMADDGKPKLKQATNRRPLVTLITGTDGKPVRVFEDADLVVMLDQPVSSFVAQLAKPAMELLNAKMEDAQKSPR